MSPTTLALVIQGIQAAIAAAPTVIGVAKAGKEFITELFSAGAITIEQQNAVHAHVDAVMQATLRGEVQPHWEVQPDPA